MPWSDKLFKYPDVFFEPVALDLPDIKKVFRWCEFFSVADGITRTIINKLSAYVVTSPVVEPKNETATRLLELFEQYDILFRLQYLNHIYLTYGNVFVSVFPDFVRELICKQCKAVFKINAIEAIKLQNYQIYGRCIHCGQTTYFDVRDVPLKDPSRLIIKFWDPKCIVIDSDPLTHRNRYLYTIPKTITNKVKKFLQLPIASHGDVIYRYEEAKQYLATIPLEFLEAIKKNKAVVFSQKDILHLRRPGHYPIWETEWGMPLPFPALKDLYAYYVLRQIADYVARERGMLLRFVFPSVPPQMGQLIDLSKYMDFVMSAIKEWEQSPGKGPFGIPFPVGQQAIGAEELQLPLDALLMMLEKRIILAMEVPQEFVYGGLSWSGSSVSLRMLENHLHSITAADNYFLNWLKDKIAEYFDIPELKKIKVRLAKPRMADDVARQRLLLELYQRGIVSEITVLQELGIDPDREFDNILMEIERRKKRTEKVAEAEAQAQATVQRIAVKSQMEAQRLQQVLLQSFGIEFEEFHRIPPEYQAIVQRLMMLAPPERAAMIDMIRRTMPVASKILESVLNKLEAMQQQQEQEVVSPEAEGRTPAEAPLPEQKPPRREEKPI